MGKYSKLTAFPAGALPGIRQLGLMENTAGGNPEGSYDKHCVLSGSGLSSACLSEMSVLID